MPRRSRLTNPWVQLAFKAAGNIGRSLEKEREENRAWANKIALMNMQQRQKQQDWSQEQTLGIGRELLRQGKNQEASEVFQGAGFGGPARVIGGMENEPQGDVSLSTGFAIISNDAIGAKAWITSNRDRFSPEDFDLLIGAQEKAEKAQKKEEQRLKQEDSNRETFNAVQRFIQTNPTAEGLLLYTQEFNYLDPATWRVINQYVGRKKEERAEINTLEAQAHQVARENELQAGRVPEEFWREVDRLGKLKDKAGLPLHGANKIAAQLNSRWDRSYEWMGLERPEAKESTTTDPQEPATFPERTVRREGPSAGEYDLPSFGGRTPFLQPDTTGGARDTTTAPIDTTITQPEKPVHQLTFEEYDARVDSLDKTGLDEAKYRKLVAIAISRNIVPELFGQVVNNFKQFESRTTVR